MGAGLYDHPATGTQRSQRRQLTWAGIFNTYYWLDPAKRIAGVFLTQILPFADHKAVALYGEFESGIYGGLKAA